MKRALSLTAAALYTGNASAAINTENWWCGSTHTEASTSCTQPCPTGVGCPLGTVCFSGITSCTSTRFCGTTLEDANTKCTLGFAKPCANGGGCAVGEACFLDTACGAGNTNTISNNNGGGNNDNNNNSNNGASYLTSAAALNGLIGTAAVEQTFLQMKDAINNNLFLYETPMMEWVPSTVYRFDGFFDGLQIMHSQGVAGKTIYLGPPVTENGEECAHCHMYGLVNVAAFLAQAMKETIRYDACDENSWDRVGDRLMYPIANACGQLGQSYQDYHCSEAEKHMECEVDPEMTITAVTNAKWWGAPGPMQCGPKSLYPQTGYWDFSYTCDNIWGTPPETCDAYEDQKGGKAINDEEYPNAAGRTDVEGCCWWGRGVIQTSGICNFGKLNYYLGKRAADEGRDARYPSIDFCRDPEAICSSKEHRELKWIAGFFYWMNDVQVYDADGWNYIEELHKFVDGGMDGDGFINSVSGIVNRGCHNPPCGTGALDGGPERAKNFLDILKEMQFSFVDVPPGQPLPTSEAPGPVQVPVVYSPPETPRPTLPQIQIPDSTPRPTPRPSQLIVALTSAMSATTVRYSCGDYQFDPADPSVPPSTDVTFDYEIHNDIDVTVGDALRDVKESILYDIAEAMGCRQTYSGRKLQGSELENIIGLQSNANDLPDPNAPGCLVDVATDDPTTCTPVKGEFTIHAKPGTSVASLQVTTEALKNLISTGMTSGNYETPTVIKTIYIGSRDEFAQPSAIIVQTDGTNESDERLKIALYCLSCICLCLMCVLWFAVWTYREKLQFEQQKHDEEMATDNYFKSSRAAEMRSMLHNDGISTPQVVDYTPNPKRNPPPPPTPRQMSQGGEQFQHRPRSLSRGRNPGMGVNSAQNMNTHAPEFSHTPAVTESEEEEIEMGAPIMPQHMPPSHAQRSKSAPKFQSMAQRRMSPLPRQVYSDGENMSSSSSSSGSGNSSDISDGESANVVEQKDFVAPPPPRSMRGRMSFPGTNTTNDYDQSVQSLRTEKSLRSQPVHFPNTGSPPRESAHHSQSLHSPNTGSSAREARQQRMAAARARAAKRRSA